MIKRITHQVLKAVDFCHSHNVRVWLLVFLLFFKCPLSTRTTFIYFSCWTKKVYPSRRQAREHSNNQAKRGQAVRFRLRAHPRTERELHRVRGHSLVSCARASSRRHSLWYARGRVGHWLRVLRAVLGSAALAWQLRSRSAVSDQEDVRQPHRTSHQNPNEQLILPRRLHTRARELGTFTKLDDLLRKRENENQDILIHCFFFLVVIFLKGTTGEKVSVCIRERSGIHEGVFGHGPE